MVHKSNSNKGLEDNKEGEIKRRVNWFSVLTPVSTAAQDSSLQYVFIPAQNWLSGWMNYIIAILGISIHKTKGVLIIIT